MVNSIGYDVVGLAEDGEQAVQMFKKLQPDVLLLDINMPNMRGYTWHLRGTQYSWCALKLDILDRNIHRYMAYFVQN